VEAAFDLKVGGAYRIVNHFADGRRITIAGLYQVIEPPHRLVFTWQTDITPQALERVTVRFEGTTDGTDITVIHKRIATADQRDSHARGWRGCLAGLTDSFSQAPSSSVALPSASPRPTLRT
ncbi:MAG: SRPBCC domain-containing protein, partial [Alphaproteobacteria bacterium]